MSHRVRNAELDDNQLQRDGLYSAEKHSEASCSPAQSEFSCKLHIFTLTNMKTGFLLNAAHIGCFLLYFISDWNDWIILGPLEKQPESPTLNG